MVIIGRYIDTHTPLSHPEALGYPLWDLHNTDNVHTCGSFIVYTCYG